LVLARRFTIFNNSAVLAAAIVLPCHGADATPPGLVTMNDYARSITDALTEPTLLVGPSAGGFAITAAAERDPFHMAGLIYLSAYIPAPGPVACRSSAGRSTPAAGGALHLADDRLSFKVDPTAARRLFFQDCPEQTAAWAVSKLGPAPVRPQSVPLFISRKSQDLPRHAILTTEDRTIPPDWQARMASRLPEACITTLPVRPFPLLCRTARSGPASHRIGTGHGLRGGNGPAAGRWQTVACRLAARQSPGRASRLSRA
jgi:pimeloyl-ACP methyl ester carboxylesterase